MSEKSEAMIREYLDKAGGPDPEKAVREVVAGRFWQTGDLENQAAAEAIWKKIGDDAMDIKELKRDFAPTFRNQLYCLLTSILHKLKKIKLIGPDRLRG
jgi:hypothetical protein